MKRFIEIKPGIWIRPEYVVRKEVIRMKYSGNVFYHIKVLSDEEYEVDKEIFDQIV
jgi:hypothetical protein